MKKLIATLAAVLTVGTALAQSVNVNVGNVSYAYGLNSSTIGTLSTSSVTLGQKTFALSDVTSITTSTASVADNTVSVSYNGTTASVVIAGNLDALVEAKVSGAHVTLLQSADVTNEITYTLSGTTTNGSFFMDGSLKATVVLAGVTIANPDSAAINIQNGKRINVTLQSGTSNTLSDGITGTDDGTDAHKACMYFQGHPEFEGTGSLTVNGNVKHGIQTHEYCQLGSTTGTINITAVSDGLHVTEYYEQRGGTVTITAASDGVDVDMSTDTTVENNGNVILSGGTLTATATGETSDAITCEGSYTQTAGTVYALASGAGSKALKTDGDATISGGTFTGFSTGAIYAEDTTDEKKSHAVSSDGTITISGGTVRTGSKTGKALKADVSLLLNGGTTLGLGAKKSAPSSASTLSYTEKSGATVTSGGTFTVSGLSVTVPTGFSLTGGYYVVAQ